ncbi:MAG: hypothetical protein ACLTTU_01990 [Bilophila wadsworthia]
MTPRSIREQLAPLGVPILAMTATPCAATGRFRRRDERISQAH